MPTCTGCFAQFSSSSSLSSHLTQTQNAVCITVCNSLECFSGHVIHPDASHGHSRSVDCLPAFDDTNCADQATGGSYETGGFRLIDSEPEGAREPYDEEEAINSKSSKLPEGHDDSTEDDFSDFLDFDNVWEAPTTHPDLPEMDSEMTNLWEQEVSSDANEGVDHHTHSALQQTRGKQTFIDEYPGDEAGRPAPTPFMPDANWCYAEHLADTTGRNPYWPFASQLDWKVAHWAKMRGPGSMAVSELLRIESVSVVTDSI